MTIGERIRFARTRKGMSAVELARLMNCTPSCITSWEADTHSPNLKSLVAICRAVNVTPDWLVGWDDEENAEPEEKAVHHLMEALSLLGEINKRKEEAS